MKRQRYLSRQDSDQLKQLIEEKTGYRIRNSRILSQAFRRRSYCAEDGGKSNELFEFIGDHVLSTFVVKRLAGRCVGLNTEGDYSFHMTENQFTALKQELTSNEMFAAIIDDWGIVEYLIVGKCDEKNRVDQETKVKADLFESVIGAIALESNWDAAILETVVSKALHLDERVDSVLKALHTSQAVHMDNAITVLKEQAEKEMCSVPQYDFVGPEQLGYDKDGNPKWGCTCSVTDDTTGIRRAVVATSKKDAKKAAAYLVLCKHFDMLNQYGSNGVFTIWRYENGKLIPDHER